MVQMVYVQRKGQKEANHDHKDMYEPLAEKKGIIHLRAALGRIPFFSAKGSYISLWS
jgi:hypothetical protein